ncbi:MAG: hypothetical protein L3K09_07620 [Thermoplasmata archaeon]|nr:hypothetical protein [Thermoplasmata archaeon]
MSRRALQLVGGILHDPGSNAATREMLRSLGVALPRAQPAMGSFLQWGRELEIISATAPEGGLRLGVRDWLATKQQQLAREGASLPQVVARLLPVGSRVLTISNSSSLRSALSSLPAARRPAVTVMRSLPGGEGAPMALSLRRSGVEATLIEDGQVDSYLPSATIVLVGADAVLRDGSLLHKVGTRQLARTAKRLSVPFHSVTGSSKFVNARPGRSRDLPARFDRTPPAWISDYWTESGRLLPIQVRRRWRRRGRTQQP